MESEDFLQISKNDIQLKKSEVKEYQQEIAYNVAFRDVLIENESEKLTI